MSGTYSIGFVGYTIENQEKIYQISTGLEIINIDRGAGEIETEHEPVPTPSEWEVYIAQIEAMIAGLESEIPTKYSDLDNDNNTVQDENYVHTDNNYTDEEKEKLSELENYDDTEIKSDIQALENSKVDKVQGKGLSTNDYTNEEKSKLAGLSNYDDTEVKQDIADLDTNKAEKSEIPDVSNFITNTVNDLVNYYLKSDTYTKTEVNNLISAISTLDIQVVQTLPTQDISTTTIYLVPKETPSTQDIYDEYIYISNSWEHIGSTEVDLTHYVQDTDYATSSKGGVFKTSANAGTYIDSGVLYPYIRNYNNYLNDNDTLFISKGTLENVITGKGLSTFSGSYNDLTNKPYTEYTFSSASVDINNLNDANYMIMNSGDLEVENDTISLSKGDLVFLNDGLVAIVCSMGNYFYEYQTDEWIGGACQTGVDVNNAIETKFANIPEITKINIPTRGTNLKNINEGIYFNTSTTGKIIASIEGTNTDIPVTKNTMVIKDNSGNAVILGKDILMILDYDSNNDYFTVNQDISNKQETLVSGNNIKTINNQSILGSGNLNISGEVPAPTTSTRGGIYAQTVQDTSNMQEVVVGSNGKAYVNNDYSSLVHNIVGEVEEEESEE